MGPPLHMQSVIGQNVMWHITVTLKMIKKLYEKEKWRRKTTYKGTIILMADF